MTKPNCEACRTAEATCRVIDVDGPNFPAVDLCLPCLEMAEARMPCAT